MKADFRAWRTRVDGALVSALSSDAPSERLAEAMRYAVLGAGKRLRPLLVYASGTACGAPLDTLDAAACAVEFIHAYSLVHDDLPAMDDDAMRRGRPTCHIVYGEAMAILAGDALQTLAFGHLADAHRCPLGEAIRLRLIGELARASGGAGMCGGQALDLAATGTHIDLDALRKMHAHKTGALIRASVLMGAIAAGETDTARLALFALFGECLGLAFQIQDDILDVTASSHALGKTAGKDAAQQKSTYASLLGLDGAQRALDDARSEATSALLALGLIDSALSELLRLAAEREA